MEVVFTENLWSQTLTSKGSWCLLFITDSGSVIKRDIKHIKQQKDAVLRLPFLSLYICIYIYTLFIYSICVCAFMCVSCSQLVRLNQPGVYACSSVVSVRLRHRKPPNFPRKQRISLHKWSKFNSLTHAHKHTRPYLMPVMSRSKRKHGEPCAPPCPRVPSETGWGWHMVHFFHSHLTTKGCVLS